MEYVIYCDESIAKGAKFSNFYGGLLVRSGDLQNAEMALAEVRAKQNLLGEIKWQKITAAYKDKYIAFIDAFFDLVANNRVKVRIMFTQNMFCRPTLTRSQKDNSYFPLYYQFLKHSFGLQYHDNRDESTLVRLYLDQLADEPNKAMAFRIYPALGKRKSRAQI